MDTVERPDALSLLHYEVHNMKHSLLTAVLSTGLLVSAPTMARQVTVEVTNMTNAAYFTPLLVATHDGYTRLFEVGSPVSGALQAMAEGGDISGLVAEVEAGGGVVVQDSAEGLLAPGQTTTATFDIRPRQRRQFILIIENDPDIARLVQTHLRDIDCQADIAVDASIGSRSVSN